MCYSGCCFQTCEAGIRSRSAEQCAERRVRGGAADLRGAQAGRGEGWLKLGRRQSGRFPVRLGGVLGLQPELRLVLLHQQLFPQLLNHLFLYKREGHREKDRERMKE